MIAVITYNHPHRKTQEVLLRLHDKNYKDVKVFGLPFVKRERKNPPIFPHRPEELLFEEDISVTCNRMGYSLTCGNADDLMVFLEEYQPEHILLAGAGLLPTELVSTFHIINAHPGWLPLSRGLDAMKWAIFRSLPLGVTLHYINHQTDAGRLIYQEKLKISKEDSFQSVCDKLWELEIQLLADAPEIIEKKRNFPLLPTHVSSPTLRMPPAIEKDLMSYFEKYKETFGE